jgi:hypothetical protein
MDELYNDIFVQRIHFMEYTIDELLIISKLKDYLLSKNINETIINDILYSFYLTYDIPITMDEINEVPLYRYYDDEPIIVDIHLLSNLIGLLINLQNQEETIMEDVVVTTDINSINNIPIKTITLDMDERCSICMVDMKENDDYMDIECNHIFHKECLITYLTNYNHICPICRKDIGNININL